MTIHALSPIGESKHGSPLVVASPLAAYFLNVWSARYFWIHLTLSDLRSKWRRSYLGMLWTVIQPLGLTALLSVVFGRIFHTDVADYAPYILSGLIFWEFVATSTIGGSLAFVQADAYIKQYPHPLAIYSLRTVLTNLAVFLCASTALIVWVLLWKPQNLGWSWLALPTVLPLLILIAWPLVTILAYTGARFRDLPPALGLALQTLWFVSPVYFEPKIFRSAGLDALIDGNPIYHLLQIIRAPMLEGNWPSPANYAVAGATAAVLFLLAAVVGGRAEKKVIYYL